MCDCRLLQTASRCVDDLLESSCTAEEIAENPDLQSVAFYSPEAIDYVCVQHHDGKFLSRVSVPIIVERDVVIANVSVRLSVTLWYRIETNACVVKLFSPSGTTLRGSPQRGRW